MKKYYSIPIILSILLVVGVDYIYANHLHPIVWSLLIIPIILFLTIYPYWKLALIAGIVVSSVISAALLNRYSFHIPSQVLSDFLISGMTNWTILLVVTRLLIKNAKINEALNQAQEDTLHQKAFYEAILENMEEQVIAFDTEGKINYFNKAAQPFQSYWDVSTNPFNHKVSFFSADAKRITRYQDLPLYRAIHGDDVLQYEMWVEVEGFAERRNLIVNGKPLSTRKGQPAGAVVVFHDMTERKRLEEENNRTKEQYKSLFEHNFDAIFSMDLEGNFITSNPVFQQKTGYTNKEMGKISFQSLVVGEDLPRTFEHFELAKQGEPQNYDLTIFNKNNQRIHANVTNVPIYVDGEVTGVFAIAKDITDQKEYEEKIRNLAYYDQLTSLPNRTLLKDRVLQAWKHSVKEKNRMALLFLDLDGFKTVNDSLGHNIGDKLLMEVSERFHQCLDDDQTLARLGGDEFIILMPSIENEKAATETADRIINSLQVPFLFEDLEFHLSVSIGIVTFAGNEEVSVDTLIKQADTAMYFIKERGKNGYEIYHPKMDIETVQKVRLENDFRYALEHKEFYLAYQPIVHLESGEIIGTEALVRWNHKQLGQIPPSEFIPLAEETGLIIPLGEWILRTACLQAKEWQNKGYPSLRISINVSVKQLQQRDKFIQLLEKVLAETQLDAKWLDLEITETILIENKEDLIETLQQIRSMGVSLSIDDFGTGYSSMSHLKYFAVNTLKIDRSFVNDVHSNEISEAIIKSIMTLAKQLNLNTIAEGIETQDQLKKVWQEDCKQMQGYYYSPPASPQQIETLLERSRGAVLMLPNDR
ncbi:EAL domain-containing protein [Niallia oryzisoli]|uniref:sensor domain-containing protein n=1 Tax=Niallia oryzisoli TaxID=1737571 RepID=UPI0037361F06